MSRKLFLAFFLSLIPTLAFGQSTTVSGNVTDLGGQVWSAGSVVATFVPLSGTNVGAYTWTGGPFTGSAITAVINGSGNYTMSIPSNTTLVPANSKWTFTANSGTTSLSTGTVTVTVTGGAQTVNFTPPALVVSAGPGAVAYADSEVQAQLGQSYYSINLVTLRLCTASTGVNCTAWTSATGTAAASVGPQFANQISNGVGGFAAGGAKDTGSVLSTGTDDFQPCGPNPVVDIRCFGGRGVSSVPQTTAGISSGSSTATLAAASTFQTGDGVVIYGAGPTLTLTTPTAPTVTPKLMAGTVGTKAVVNANAGATSYQYQVVAIDKAGGVTAASTATAIVTGLATLGRVSVVITSMTRANNVVSFVMSAPTDLVVSSAIYVENASDTSFNGAYNVGTVTDTTHFTANDILKDTRNGATVSATGGSLGYVNCNFITWPAVNNAWIYAVYGRVSGSMVFLGFSRPLDTYFEDFGNGSPNIMGTNIYRNPWLSNTPPVSAQNDYLSTTITAGGGTTTVTLANSAVNTVAGATFLFDDVPAMAAALTAAGFTEVSIPYSSVGSFVFNSYLRFTAGAHSIRQAGAILVNETIEFPNAPNWRGIAGSNTTSDRGWRVAVTCNAVPCMYSATSGGLFSHLILNNGKDQSLLFLEDGAFPASQFDEMTFSTGAGSDYLSVGYEGRGGAQASFEHLSCNASVTNGGSGINWFWAPCIHIRGDLANLNPNGHIAIRDFRTLQRSMLAIEETLALSSHNGYAWDVYSNGGISPIVTFQSDVGCCLGGAWDLNVSQFDTTFVPIWANLLGGSAATIRIANAQGNSQNLFSGSTNIGQVIFEGSTAGASGTTVVTYPSTGVYGNYVTGAYGTGTVNHLISTFATAPTASGPTAGGTVPLGAHSYKIQYLDVNSNTMAPSVFSNSITATGGNQTITVTPVNPPVGAVTYYLIRDTNARLGCSATPVGTAFVDTQISPCGQSITTTGAGDSTLSSTGVTGPSFGHVNNGFTHYDSFPNSLTANRSVFLPDNTGYLPVSSYLNSFYDNFNRANGGLGANWTTYQNGVGVFINPSIVSNQASVGSSASRNAWAFLTSNTFSTDQFSQLTIVGDVASANTIYYAVVKLKNTGPGGAQGYFCSLGSTTAAIGKISGTGPANLTSSTVSAAAVNDTIRCDYILVAGVGNLTMTRNGSVVLTTTDSTITTGAPGFGMVNNGATAAIDNWSGGNEHALTHLDVEQDWSQPQHFLSFSVGAPTNGLFTTQQGTGGKIQSASGGTTNGDLIKYDSSGNAVDALILTSNVVPLVAQGTSTLGNTAVGAGTCATVVTTSATGTLTSSTVEWTYASAPTTSDGLLNLSWYVTANNVNWKVCNTSAASLTPSGLVINWKVK